MKKILVPTCILVLACSCSSPLVKGLYAKPNLNNINRTTLSTESHGIISDFAVKTIQKIANNNENIIYSPTSHLMALLMLSEIATNELHEELLELFNLSNQESVRDFSSELFRSSFLNNKSQLKLSTSAWANDCFTPNPETINNLTEKYYSTYYQGNLAEKEASTLLDSWLKEATNKLIDLKSFSSNPFENPDALMVLFSSIYAKAKWEHKYEKPSDIQFKNADGTTNIVEGLHEVNYRPYLENEYYASFIEPLKDNFSYMLIKPHQKYTTADIINNSSLMEHIFDYTRYQEVQLGYSFPFFETEKEIDLLDITKELGAIHLKSSGQLGNLTKDNTDIRQVVSSIQQNSKIIVNLSGIEAAAVTGISISKTSATIPLLTLKIDSPFIYALLYNGTPHFLGTINYL